MTVAVPVTEPTNDDAFAAAFDSLTVLESGSDSKGVVPNEPSPVAAEPIAAVGITADNANPIATSATVDPAPATVDPAPATVDPAPAKPVDTAANDDMLRRLAALVREPAAPTSAPLQPQRAAAVELFTPEEKTVLAAYDKDWPDVSRAEAIRVRAAQLEVVDHMSRQFVEIINPLMARVAELSTSAQLSDLEAAVPDYSDVRDKVIEWAGKETLPYLRAAYDHVIKQGTAAEVADLIQRYKQATGAPIVAHVQPAQAPSPPAELPAATKKAAAALAPVRSIRSAPVSGGIDKNDFEGAFESYAKMEAAAEAARRGVR